MTYITLTMKTSISNINLNAITATMMNDLQQHRHEMISLIDGLELKSEFIFLSNYFINRFSCCTYIYTIDKLFFGIHIYIYIVFWSDFAALKRYKLEASPQLK